MKRKDVYKAIDNEREYQNTVRKQNERETRNDDDKSISDFIIYMETKLGESKKSIYYLDEPLARHNILKIIALGVACLESFGEETDFVRF